MTTQVSQQTDANGMTDEERQQFYDSLEKRINEGGPPVLYQTILEWFNTYSIQSDSFDLKRWLSKRVTRYLKTNDDALRQAKRAIASLGHPLNVFLSGDALLARKALGASEYVGCGFIFYPAKAADGKAVLSKSHNFMPIVDTKGYPVVSRVVPGSPADHANFRPGDVVISINGRSARHRTIDSLTSQVDSLGGTTVRVRRSTDKHPVTIVQAATPVPVVSTRFGDIGYLRISTFLPEDLPAQVLAAMNEVDDCEAIVLDIRGSPGGPALTNIKVLSVFLEEGEAFTVHNDGSSPWERKYAVHRDCLTMTGPGSLHVLNRLAYKLRHRPLFLLVDGNTRSSPEVFTQALRDYGIAMIIGTRTFGKGLVQGNIEVLKYASIETLYGRWLSPKGTWIGDCGVTESSGIIPDVEVAPTPGVLFGEAGDHSLKVALRIATESLAVKRA